MKTDWTEAIKDLRTTLEGSRERHKRLHEVADFLELLQKGDTVTSPDTVKPFEPSVSHDTLPRVTAWLRAEHRVTPNEAERFRSDLNVDWLTVGTVQALLESFLARRAASTAQEPNK